MQDQPVYFISTDDVEGYHPANHVAPSTAG